MKKYYGVLRVNAPVLHRELITHNLIWQHVLEAAQFVAEVPQVVPLVVTVRVNYVASRIGKEMPIQALSELRRPQYHSTGQLRRTRKMPKDVWAVCRNRNRSQDNGIEINDQDWFIGLMLRYLHLRPPLREGRFDPNMRDREVRIRERQVRYVRVVFGNLPAEPIDVALVELRRAPQYRRDNHFRSS